MPHMPGSHESVTALLLAGARPRAEERGLATGAIPKPLLPVAGMPMLRRVVHTLLRSDGMGDVHVVDDGAAALLERAGVSHENVRPAPGHASVSQAVANNLDDAWPYLVVTADHALLTPEILSEFISGARASGADLCVGVVARDVLQNRFPGSRRTWLKFRGGAYTGANLFWLKNDRVRGALSVWRTVEKDRKRGRAIMGAFGPLLLLAVALRLFTLNRALTAAGRRIGCTAAAVQLQNAEAAIDVDSQADLEQAEAILQAREREWV